MTQPPFTISQSGAFVEEFTIEPTGKGKLGGLTFAVKDLIDIAGKITGCGNPAWRETHPPAKVNAVCVDQLLSAGAKCVGKVLTDELAFSLLGENYFYGTPLNPKAPDRVCGGSSCGSASAVACGLVDFALGTDTGGSVRVPAANCGIYGMRPTHGRISVAGVNPLSPTLDTVGILAATADVLGRSMSVLLGCEVSGAFAPTVIYIIREAFDLCDPEVRTELEKTISRLQQISGSNVRSISMREIDEDEGSTLDNWRDVYRVLQWAESESCLGSWVAAVRPEFGPLIRQSFHNISTLDRSTIAQTVYRREQYFKKMQSFLGKSDLLCIPTMPSPAPLKGSIQRREQSGPGYYPRALALTAIAGVARLPQITLPAANLSGLPLGLSLLARHGEDAFLIDAAKFIDARLLN